MTHEDAFLLPTLSIYFLIVKEKSGGIIFGGFFSNWKFSMKGKAYVADLLEGISLAEAFKA